MSRESVELQTLIEHTDMSGTGSFSSPPVTQGQTDGVGPVGPFYQTVTDARTAHHQYLSEQVKSSSPQHVSKGHEVPAEADPHNEYDLINEKQVARGQQHPSAKHLEAENILYADTQGAAEQFKHATLNMDRGSMRYAGHVAALVSEPGNKGTSCCKWSTVCSLFFLFVVFLMVSAALVMVLLVWFGVHTPSCACSAVSSDVSSTKSPQTMDTDVVQLQTNLSNLQVKVAMLVDRFGHSVVRGVNYSTTLSGVTLAPKCNTTIEGPCQVESPRQDLGVVFSVVNCPSSQFDIAADEAATGMTIVDIKCIQYGARLQGSAEENPFIATLRNNGGGLVNCLCYTIATPTSTESYVLHCAMEITRCPAMQDLNGNLLT